MVIGLGLAVISQRQLIVDVVRAAMYQPTDGVQRLANELELSWLGKTYFYASQPVFDTTSAASDWCAQSLEESSAVLGCYANGIIYIYDIDNAELQGVEEVTAAHELLHAVHERLSVSERAHVHALIEAEIDRLQDDSEFMQRMQPYQGLDVSTYADELYAVIGTEVSDISDELASHYAAYFGDRTTIVALHEGYKHVFTDVQAQAEALVTEYNNTVTARNALVEAINSEYAAVEQSIRAVNNGRSATAAEIAAVNRQIDAYNATLTTAQQQLAEYDSQLSALKEKIQATAIHQQTLNATIDSSLAPPPSL